MSTIKTTIPARIWAGVALALAAAAGFAFSNASAHVADIGGSNALTVAAMRFLVPSAALAAWLHLAGARLMLPGRDALIAAILGIVTGLYTWALLTAFTRIPFALAVLIFYLFPLLAAVTVALLGWEKLSWKTVTGLVLAFAGLALALNVGAGNLNIAGLGIAFLAAIGLAIVAVVSGRLLANLDPRPVTLHMAAVACVELLILCAVAGDFALPKTQAGWIGFLASTALYGFAMIAFFIAISIIGAVHTSLLSYAETIISAVLGVIVLGQALTLVQIAGIALVIAALAGTTLWK
ncbi:MAG: DMT family transporter [Hyphomicrobiales bacterium]|nr:DMT family transporter [Hyphomicrobiales bacterium]